MIHAAMGFGDDVVNRISAPSLTGLMRSVDHRLEADETEPFLL